ncbi:hypothetical protein GDO86_011421 [Hymenochirus boettgeri]|uniref:C2H2-type domain-containing protein n=1 Tax=Hymenochirus boettgeri TaxID=247094 RepID=A0A8T2JGB3_9PIPI|nr:hypothetical protein GDO86_011421 [Hymenochirus boettgeri]
MFPEVSEYTMDRLSASLKKKGGLAKDVFACDECGVVCATPMHLFNHAIGQKHKALVMKKYQDMPEKIEQMQRLQFCIDLYVKDEPLIGLEHIKEDLHNNSYVYICGLCDFNGPLPPMMLHITGKKHRRNYLKKHHPDIFLDDLDYMKRSEEMKKLKDLAYEVEKKYGRKRIQEIDSRPNSSILDPEKKDEWSPQGFRNNAEFFSYLKNFEIKSIEDASFICEITKNFTTALVNFQREEARNKMSRKPSNCTSQASFKNPLEESKVSPTSVSSNDITPGTSTDLKAIPPYADGAIDVFFNSIKNMEASEVHFVFQKIAATNPAFKGMDIPSLMKYLKETGKLKS